MNYDEAIKDNQELKEKYTTNLRSNQMFDNVDEALQRAKKEHELLELYKKIVSEPYETDYQIYWNQIKALEEELNATCKL